MKNIIAIVGMAGSGKSVASQFFEEKGYKCVYFGGVIYQKMKEAGIEITPESQKDFRENLRKEHGMGAVAKILLPDITTLCKTNDVVLDGLYSWDEYKILIETCHNLKVICVVADKKIRYQRIGNRIERPFTEEEMIKRDLAEIENSAKGGPIAYADYYILNNGSMDDYQRQLQEIEKEFK